MKVNFKAIGDAAKHSVRVTARFLGKHKRLIGSVASAGLTVTGTVWACKKTFDISPKIKEIHEQRDAMTDKNDIRKSAVDEAKLYAKTYAGPVACLVGGQAVHIAVESSLAAENAALAAGLGAMQTRMNKMEQVVDQIADGEVSPYAIKDPSIIGLSPYAVLFDDSHPMWGEDPMWRFNFTHEACRSAMRTLERRAGYTHPKPLYMNDIYEYLAYPDTKLGNRGGYFWDTPHCDDPVLQIDFLYYDAETKQRITSFPDGIQKPVWIDFNVPYGDVADMLPKN